jgi:ribosomal-protein-alanine N-acetyltransferase
MGTMTWPVVLRVEDGRPPSIILRPLTMRDRDAWVRLRGENVLWLRPWDATRPDGAPAAVSFRNYVNDLNRNARQGRHVPFAVEVDGQLVGSLTASSITYGALRSASIGYWLARSATGRGTMTRAVARVIDYLFTERGLHRVEINIRPENHASLAIARRLGLREEGLRRRFLHIDGDWRDHLSFAVTAEELCGARLSDRLAAPQDV